MLMGLNSFGYPYTILSNTNPQDQADEVLDLINAEDDSEIATA